MSTRRTFLQRTFALGAGAVSWKEAWGQRSQVPHSPHETTDSYADKNAPARDHGPAQPPVGVESPDLGYLPWHWDNGVKVFHLIAEPVKQELIPGRVVNLWGYNGSAPGPTIEVNEGDRVRLIVENHLPEPTSMHWHGFEIPIGMDGVPNISQKPIPPGGRFVYEFTLHQEGTYFYHSHMAMQEMLGMIGAFVIHPARPYVPAVDRDFSIILQEYAILPNSTIPNTMNMEFNWLTMNGKSGPDITPMVVRHMDRVRIRLINMGMDHHPIHLHGHQFWITGTEGGRQPESNWIRRNTVLVGVAQAFDVEFIANNPGDWMFHCHLPHHMMNQMASLAGPMTRGGSGMPAGEGMDEGMGMPRQGSATSDSYGPSLGRGMGAGDRERQVTNGLLQPSGVQAMPGMQHAGGATPIAPNANSVPGFPQDAFMEGPMMNMDKAVAKPETFGLPPGWSEFMQGMMTLVRVLPHDQYEHIMALRAQQGSGRSNPSETPVMKMPGMDMPGMKMPGR